MKKLGVLIFTAVLLFGILAQIAIIKADNDTNTTNTNITNTNESTSVNDTNNTNNHENETERDNQTRAHNKERIGETIRERNRLGFNESELPDNCSITGVVIKCQLKNGTVMAVFAGKSGNTIIQVRGVNASTRVALYKDNNGTVYGNTSNNKSFIINYFPDQIRERIRARINASTEGNASIEIDEDGQYQVDVQKRARFLGIFKVRERVRFHVDPETGAILNEHAPWWGFLAKDEKDNSSQ